MDPFELDKQFQINSNHEDNYYNEYCRLLLANIALTNHIKELTQQKNQIANRLRKYQDDQFMSQSDKNNDKNKRLRRNADQIQRYYKCVVKSCAKSYGSEGSLNQHYKLKHPQIYVTLPNVQSNVAGICKQQNDQNVKDKQNRHKVISLKNK